MRSRNNSNLHHIQDFRNSIILLMMLNSYVTLMCQKLLNFRKTFIENIGASLIDKEKA